jgi:hypothetical protein
LLGELVQAEAELGAARFDEGGELGVLGIHRVTQYNFTIIVQLVEPSAKRGGDGAV